MPRVLLVDGENLKGKIRHVFQDAGERLPPWHTYDFRGLFRTVLADTSLDRQVFYFARIKEHAESREKSRRLIESQRLLKTHLERQGFEVIMTGRVRGQFELDHENRKVLVFTEKGVDVNIAVDMVSIACDHRADEIILCSSDSDLQPAIRETTRRGLTCVYLGFEAQPNKGMTYTTQRTILIRNTEVLASAQTGRKAA